MAIARWIKDPGALKDYTINWAPWLNGDTIVTSTWSNPALPMVITRNTRTATTTTAAAPYTNDGYITVTINGTAVKLMTAA